MKNLLTNSISTSVGFPVKSGTLDFLQTASSEMLNALGRSIIGKDFSTSIPYALYGCNNTGSGSSYVIQEGAILWDGVLYLVPAVSFTLTGGNSVFVATSTTYVTSAVADPVTFTDGVARSVHADTKMSVYQSAMSPSPTQGFAYTSLEYSIQPISKSLTPTTNYVNSVLQYYRNRNGNVTFNGYIFCSAGAATLQTVGTLPVGYRPPYLSTFSANKRDNSGGVTPVILRIFSTGEIEIYAASSISSLDIIPLTGLQFTNYQ
jgi:hypothetical protein